MSSSSESLGFWFRERITLPSSEEGIVSPPFVQNDWNFSLNWATWLSVTWSTIEARALPGQSPIFRSGNCGCTLSTTTSGPKNANLRNKTSGHREPTTCGGRHPELGRTSDGLCVANCRT
eukprot:2505563-Pyramimonas_sp.AAC.1